MHPDIDYAVAQARIADLHRTAAQHRLARLGHPASPVRRRLGDRLLAARRASADWLTARRRAAEACCPTQPVCCAT